MGTLPATSETAASQAQCLVQEVTQLKCCLLVGGAFLGGVAAAVAEKSNADAARFASFALSAAAVCNDSSCSRNSSLIGCSWDESISH